MAERKEKHTRRNPTTTTTTTTATTTTTTRNNNNKKHCEKAECQPGAIFPSLVLESVNIGPGPCYVISPATRPLTKG